MLTINRHTKISVIIKANAESIDAMASIAKSFKKLKNPILRKLMAPRVTLAEAASIGGCSVEDFKRVLVPLGFVFEDSVMSGEENQAGSQEPAWLSMLNASNTDEFDVRQLIASGDDPLKNILQRYKALPTGHCLCIVNTFIPYPLLTVLGNRGAVHHIESKKADLHYTWFFKSDKTETVNMQPSGNEINLLDQQSFESALASYSKERIITLDVRDLPMPQPMERILETLTSLEQEDILYVLHKRIPLHLMEELEDSAFQIRISEYRVDDIRLLINVSTR